MSHSLIQARLSSPLPPPPQPFFFFEVLVWVPFELRARKSKILLYY